MLVRALLGMLPKNKLRKDIIGQNVIMFREQYHTMGNILPQFTDMEPRDINEDTGLVGISKENSIVIYKSSSDLPEEYKDLPEDLDDSMDIPLTAMKKTHTERMQNLKLGAAVMDSHKSFRRFKRIK